MDDVAIKVENLSKDFKLPHEKSSTIKSAVINFWRRDRGYDIQPALKDINFEIKKGEFFGIVGRNGSGKSTLLKLLAGIYSPTKGQVHINGSLTPFIELGVGFNDELTGRENVFLNGALLGFNRKETRTMYRDIVEFAELEKFMNQKLKNYSSGMKVRLAFSIAIRAKSDILLIDEVLAVGDEAFQRKCFNVFRQLKNDKKTIVLVTHDMSNLERFCDKALVINKGRLLDLSDPKEIIAQYSRLNVEVSQPNSNKQQSNRWGSGLVKVKSIRMLNSEGRSAKTFKQGEEAKVDIKLEYPKGKKKPIVCGLGFTNSDGVTIAGPNSQSEATVIPMGASEISFKIKSLSWAPDEYQLTVAIYDIDVSEPYDYLDRYFQFSIVSDHIVHGLVEVDGQWSHKRT